MGLCDDFLFAFVGAGSHKHRTLRQSMLETIQLASINRGWRGINLQIANRVDIAGAEQSEVSGKPIVLREHDLEA